MAGGRKTGGRKKGSLNKRTGEIELSRNGLLPLDYMLGVMRDEKADPYRRDEMQRLQRRTFMPSVRRKTSKGGRFRQ